MNFMKKSGGVKPMKNTMPNSSMEQGVPKKKSVFLLVLLSIITLGIYPYFWYISRSKELNNLNTTSKSKKGLFIASAILYVLAIVALFSMIITAVVTAQTSDITNFTNPPLMFLIFYGVFATFLVLSCLILIINAFMVRKILSQALINKGSTAKASIIFTLFFNLFYLQYEINRIISDKENNKKIGPWIFFILEIIFLIFIILIFTLLQSILDSIISLLP